MHDRRDWHKNPAPFLRWAGGKSKIVHLLAPLTPPKGSYRRYIEPFLGSGALFFYIQPPNALLADLNEHLVNCFQQVAENATGVSRLLQRYLGRHKKRYYYRVRDQGLQKGSPLQRAARFIYINKCAFNGIFRVNREGKFNVPYGPSLAGPAVPSEARLRAASRILARAEIVAAPFEITCGVARPGDFVYLDPPYPPIGKSANFTHYTPDRFGIQDQKKVAEAFHALDRKGCLVMLSNSDQAFIRALYRDYPATKLHVTRWVGSDGRRFKVNELVVTNYPTRSQSSP